MGFYVNNNFLVQLCADKWTSNNFCVNNNIFVHNDFLVQLCVQWTEGDEWTLPASSLASLLKSPLHDAVKNNLYVNMNFGG